MSTSNQSTPILSSFENDPAVVYILGPHLRILYCNQAWDRFAVDNGGINLERERQVGVSVMDVIPPPLKPYFRSGFEGVRATGQHWSHSYECSSATQYRQFHMLVYPSPESDGLVVVNSLAVERPHDFRGQFSEEAVYRNKEGLVTMCCECRRTCRGREPDVWDWVPAFIERPPRPVSHGICSACMKLIYPAFAED